MMLLFGGSGLEAGGYLEPEVYALVRTVRTDIEEFEKFKKVNLLTHFYNISTHLWLQDQNLIIFVSLFLCYFLELYQGRTLKI